MQKVRSLASVLCIILAAVLLPVGVVASWANVQLVDEEAFVAAFAPLAEDPAVQREIAQQTIGLIEREVDIDGLTAEVFGGIAELGLSDRAAAALGLLEGPAAAGLRNMLHTGVSDFVQSELFAGAWQSSLRVSHRALVAVATQDAFARGAVTIDSDGEVAVQLAPIIQEVKRSLTDSGFALAAAIPTIEASIVVAQSDALPMIALVYALANVAGWWLPVLTVAFLVLGVLLARRTYFAVVGAAVAASVSSAALLAAFAIASIVVQASAIRMGVSAAALEAVLSHTLAAMRASAWTLLVLGVVVAVITVAWVKLGWGEYLRESAVGQWWARARTHIGARLVPSASKSNKENEQ